MKRGYWFVHFSFKIIKTNKQGRRTITEMEGSSYLDDDLPHFRYEAQIENIGSRVEEKFGCKPRDTFIVHYQRITKKEFELNSYPI
jgi:hypothetical protein